MGPQAPSCADGGGYGDHWREWFRRSFCQWWSGIVSESLPYVQAHVPVVRGYVPNPVGMNGIARPPRRYNIVKGCPRRTVTAPAGQLVHARRRVPLLLKKSSRHVVQCSGVGRATGAA